MKTYFIKLTGTSQLYKVFAPTVTHAKMNVAVYMNINPFLTIGRFVQVKKPEYQALNQAINI